MNKQELIEQLATEFSELKRILFKSLTTKMEPLLPQAQTELLFLIARHESLTMTRLAAELRVSGGAATQLVDALAAHGLLERRQDKKDRRVTHIELSDKGKKKMDYLRGEYMQCFRMIVEKLSIDDLKTMTTIIKKITAAN